MGLLHQQELDFEQSIACLERANQLQPDSVPVLANLGNSYARCGCRRGISHHKACRNNQLQLALALSDRIKQLGLPLLRPSTHDPSAAPRDARPWHNEAIMLAPSDRTSRRAIHSLQAGAEMHVRGRHEGCLFMCTDRCATWPIATPDAMLGPSAGTGGARDPQRYSTSPRPTCTSMVMCTTVCAVLNVGRPHAHAP